MNNDLAKGEYVRFPADIEDRSDPRDFLMGRIENVNKIAGTLSVHIYDPFKIGAFFEIFPGVYECPLEKTEHCCAYKGAKVVYNHEVYTVLFCTLEDEHYAYWVQNIRNRTIIKVNESVLEIPFSCMDISPLVQMKSYELQNPQWYIGRSIVTRSINVLENSISGFTELAGCKIELLPHQLAVILRCTQSKECRYMLADEVGMGKTIEALGVLKVYFSAHANKSALIVVPASLKEQWKSEMLFKFDLSDSLNADNNKIMLISSKHLSDVVKAHWDFMIIDEAHHYLTDPLAYENLQSLSSNSDNVLLLSATPVQERAEEYLKLVRLLNPEWYSNVSLEDFERLMERQRKIVSSVYDIYSSLADFQETKDELFRSGSDAHNDSEAEEIYEEILENFMELCDFLGDEKIKEDLSQVSFEEDDFSIHRIQALLVYVTERYQINASVIRNRRSMLQDRVAHRGLETIEYDIQNSDDQFESGTYSLLYDWVKGLSVSEEDFIYEIFPVLKAFFSSSFAFRNRLKEVHCAEVPEELKNTADQWVRYEKIIADDIFDAIDSEEKNARLIEVFHVLDEKIRSEKVVLFTDFPETLQYYYSCMREYYGDESVAEYAEFQSEMEKELAVFHFQNNPDCHFLICDKTGGEGKNFQIADYLVHLDLPWDAGSMEQRIGRLDRLGRNPEKPVISLVLYETGTLEESIFHMFNEGLAVFTKSLSGLEIAMGELNKIIIRSVMDDMNYGLQESIGEVINTAAKMNKGIKAEQIYDIAGYEYKTLNQKIDHSIQRLYRQDSEVFYGAMNGWASLTGFKMHTQTNGTVEFSRGAFSYKSAKNTMLIPPDWSKYQNDERSRHIEKIQALDGKENRSDVDKGLWIRGTFNRSQAIRSDFLHFFAPGDPIFDCIVNNAMNSYKGRSSALKMKSGINWMGLVFSFTCEPDYSVLYENGIEKDRIKSYLGYLEGGEARVPVAFSNPDKIPSKEVLREYRKLISPTYLYNKNITHLGKRARSNALFKAKQLGISNAEYFREFTGEDQWPLWVDQAYAAAKKSVRALYEKSSRLDLAGEEMKTALSVRTETGNLSNDEVQGEARENELLMKALQNARPKLDSVLFLWLSKDGIN